MASVNKSENIILAENVTSVSNFFVPGTGSNRKAMAAVGIKDATATSVNAPTLDGNVFTQVTSPNSAKVTQNLRTVDWYFLDEANIPSGIVFYQVTAAVAIDAFFTHILFLEDCAQGQPNAVETETAINASQMITSIDPTAAPGILVNTALMEVAQPWSAVTGQTEHRDIRSSAESTGFLVASKEYTTGASNSMEADPQASESLVHSVVAISEPGSGNQVSVVGTVAFSGTVTKKVKKALSGLLVTSGEISPLSTENVDLEGFRFRNDDGSESSATWKAAQDTTINAVLGEPIRLRCVVNATGFNPDPLTFELQCQKTVAGTWRKVGEALAEMDLYPESPNIPAGGAFTTAQLTAPSGKTAGVDFTAGRIRDNQAQTILVTDIGNVGYTEMEWALLSQPGNVSDGDSVDFRIVVYSLGVQFAVVTATTTPQISFGNSLPIQTGTVAFSGTLTKKVHKQLGGTVTASGDVVISELKKQVSIVGTVEFSGTVTIKVKKRLSGTIQARGALTGNPPLPPTGGALSIINSRRRRR